MGLLSKEALLGASDLTEKEVELPSIGGSVRVRSLPAAYANKATSEALELITGPRGEQTARISTEKLELYQVLHGLVEPRLTTLEEAEQFAQKCGPAWRKVVETIDAISGIDKEAIEKANAAFPVGRRETPGEVVGAGTPTGDS